MPRPRKNPLPVEAELTPADATFDNAADGAENSSPVRRRRRRRTAAQIAEQQGSETTLLVEAVLHSRGARGATPDMLQNVITWARTVRIEGDALRELSGRPRRQKTQAPMERIARYELNRALLEGVLNGSVAIDVQEDGSLQFFHGSIGPGNWDSLPISADEITTEGSPT